LIATREAQLLFPEIAKLDEQMQAVQRLGESLKEGTDGSTIRVLAAPALAQTVVADAAVAFSDQHPGVKLSIRSYYSDNATASIALMEADVGILYQSLPHPAIRETLLARIPLVCVGHPSLLPETETIALMELQGRELVAPDPGDPLGRLLSKRLAECAISVDQRFTAQAYHALIALAARAHCLTIVDAASAVSATLQGLRVVPIAPAIAIPVVASVAISGERSALVGGFIESCRQALKGR